MNILLYCRSLFCSCVEPYAVIKLLAFTLLISSLPQTEAEALYFMADALEKNSEIARSIDLSRFEHGEQMPGIYRVEIWLNHEYVRTDDISFISTNGMELSPKLNRDMLEKFGVRISILPKLAALAPDTEFTNLGEFIPGAISYLDFDKQKLNISIPQYAMDIRARGTVDPSRWEQGIPAFLLNYSANGSRNWSRPGNTEEQFYLNLQNGLNVGPLRLRNYSTVIKNSEKLSFSSLSTTLSRDMQFLKGQLQLGDTTTPGDIFDSVMFRGMQVYSDDAMLPESMRGFAPVIRGIARSNAMVTVKQNGYTIYQTYVSPGRFEIKDLYPTSASGDLDITVTEADGNELHFIQPFPAVPVMLREGRIKYAFSGGKYRTKKQGTLTPRFGVGTLSYGISNYLTIYGGMLAADNYASSVLGSGLSLGELGALSVDTTVANNKLEDAIARRQWEQSYRVQYTKTVATTDTSLRLASYRYSTKGFYTFQEANENPPQGYNKRNRLQLNINQSLINWGNIYISAYQQDYWRRKGYERTVSAGFNTSIDEISYSLGLTFSEVLNNLEKDQLLSFSMQVPLSKWLPQSWVSYNVSALKNGPKTHLVGLSGTALTDNSLSYSLQQGYTSSGNDVRNSVSAAYKGGFGTVRAGYNYDRNYSMLNFGLQGGIVAHENGVTFSQQLGDTIALVQVEDMPGLKVRNNPGVITDRRGYAVVPYTSAYKENRITIDTGSLGLDTDIEESVVSVVPTRGAVVRAPFYARTGSRALIKLLYSNKPVPFGSIVKLNGSNVMSIVGADGEVYLSGLNNKDIIFVMWGDTSCQAQVNSKSQPGSIQRLSAVCYVVE